MIRRGERNRPRAAPTPRRTAKRTPSSQGGRSTTGAAAPRNIKEMTMGICERCGRPHDDGVDVEYDLPVNVDRALSAFDGDGFCPSCLAAFIGEWAAYPPQMLCLGHITPPADKDVRQIGGRDGWWRVWAGDNSVGWKSAICRDPALADII